MSCGSCQRVGIGRQSLLEQRDRLVGPARPVRRRHRQEDRAEPIGDDEVRIERRRQIEQRLEQFEPADAPARACGRVRSAGWCGSSRRRRRGRRTTGSADRRSCPTADTAGAPSADGERIQPFARVKHAGGERQAGDPGASGVPRRRTASGHLNSRRENTATDAPTSVAEYTAAYSSVESTKPELDRQPVDDLRS